MAWKVLITAAGVFQSGQRAQDLLREAGCELVRPDKSGPFKGKDLSDLLTGKDAVLASLDDYSAAALSSPAATQLKIIARWGVGYDSVDVAAATANGIAVTYTPGVLSDGVADYTFALLLSLARRIPEGNDAVRRNAWQRFLGGDVGGKNLGIIGYGRIGQAVVRRALGFNMRVLVHTAHPPAGQTPPGIQFVPLETLLRDSDFVSVHTALTATNRGLLGEPEFRKMKRTAYLINTARGSLLDEAALARALHDGRIAGAALDVFVTEPLPADSPLRHVPNLVLSPHQASFARDTGERVSLSAAQAILDVMNGRRPEHLLNPEVLQSPRLRARFS